MPGKNLESFEFLNPMGASAESGWEPGVKTRRPQDQDVKPEAGESIMQCWAPSPKLSGFKPPPPP